MPIIASDSRKDFTPAPEGLHQAVCCDVVDKGLRKTPWGEKHKIELRWQIEGEPDESGHLPMVTKWYTLSLSDKAILRHHLEAWRGRKFTTEELQGFDLEKLIGVNCQIQIAHDLGAEGKIYANVQAIVPLGKGMTKMRPSEDYVRVQDRDKTKPVDEVAEEDESVPF
jgi:hypothetical protein